MFGVDTSELIIVAVLALLFIGPKELPRAMMVLGRWIGKIRATARHFTAGIENVVREAELEEMERTWRAENQRILAQYPADGVYPEGGSVAEETVPVMTSLPPLDEPTLPLEAPAAPDPDPRPTSERPLP